MLTSAYPVETVSGRYRPNSDDLAMFRPVLGEPPKEERRRLGKEVEDYEFVVADDVMAVHRLETSQPASLNCLYLPPSCARMGFSRTER